MLAADEAESLATAVNRLQQFRDEQWSTEQRAHWAERLSLQRQLQIERLQRYRKRGLFPQKEHDPTQAVPVFVDNHNTACAVGHLMRESGWQEVVATIERTNNLVYLPDVTTGPVLEWIAYSGLTKEEAALIQPGYEVPSPDARMVDLLAGSSLSHGGLRYDNFTISAQLGAFYTFDDASQNEILGGFDTYRPYELDPLRYGVAVGNKLHRAFPEVPESGLALYTTYEDWLYFGAYESYEYQDIIRVFQELLFVDGFDVRKAAIQLTYSFDVSVLHSGSRIAGASITSDASFHLNYIQNDESKFIVNTTISEDVAILGLESTDEYFFNGQESAEFNARTSIRVSTTVDVIGDGALFGGLSHSFLLVPEPTSFALLLVGVLASCLKRRVQK